MTNRIKRVDYTIVETSIDLKEVKRIQEKMAGITPERSITELTAPIAIFGECLKTLVTEGKRIARYDYDRSLQHQIDLCVTHINSNDVVGLTIFTYYIPRFTQSSSGSKTSWI